MPTHSRSHKGTSSIHHVRVRKPAPLIVNDQVIDLEEASVIPLLSIIDAPIVILDRRGRVRFFNKTCEKLTGFSAGEIRNKKVWEALILPEEQAAVRDVFSRLCITELENRNSNYWKTKEGSTVYISWKNTAVLDKAGRIKYVISTGKERSLEKNLALKVELEKQFPLIFEAAPDGMIAVSEDGTIIYANAQMKRLFGYNRQELEGTRVEGLIPERFRAVHEGFRKQYTKAPDVRSMGRGRELMARRKDGSEFHVEISLSPVTVCGKSIIVSAIRDASETWQLEQGLKSLLKEKDEMFAELHHRVKNNLQLIISVINLTSRSVADKKALEALSDVRERIRCTAALHELLQESTDLRWVNLKEYIDKLVHTLSGHYSSPETPIEVITEFEEVTLDMKDALKIGLIISELLSNSSKYAFPSEMKDGVVRISGKKHTEGTLRITLSDNGAGLPENFSLDSPKSLGTRLIGHFVRELGGRAEAFNEGGAVFRFTLPCKEGEGAVSPTSEASPAPRPV